MKAVVTGCAGFIGSHLSSRLLEEGWSVVGIDSFSPTYGTHRRRSVMDAFVPSPHFEFIEADLNAIDLRTLFTDTDVVFHLAARPGVRASWSDFPNISEANILATQRVLDALAGQPRTRLVFASSSSVYGRAEAFPTSEDSRLAPVSPYGVTKAACESLIEAYSSEAGITAASLRYFTVYGPRQRSDMAFTRWISAALRSEPLPIFGDGSAVRDFTFVDDVVEATVQVALADLEGHEIFNVAGGSPASIIDVVTIIGELLGRRIDLEHLPRPKGDPQRTGGDTTRIRRRAGWQPRWGLRDGLAAQVEWLRTGQDRLALAV